MNEYGTTENKGDRIFYFEREWCSRDGKLCCFHIRIFGRNVMGRKDGIWYIFNWWIK